LIILKYWENLLSHIYYYFHHQSEKDGCAGFGPPCVCIAQQN